MSGENRTGIGKAHGVATYRDDVVVEIDHESALAVDAQFLCSAINLWKGIVITRNFDEGVAENCRVGGVRHTKGNDLPGVSDSDFNLLVCCNCRCVSKARVDAQRQRSRVTIGEEHASEHVDCHAITIKNIRKSQNAVGSDGIGRLSIRVDRDTDKVLARSAGLVLN